jgi:hypothetical protein
LKLGGGNEAPAATAPTPEPATQSLDFGAESPETPAGPEASPEANDKPFDDKPFDAGVEASEDSDPKKFIEQLSGKLGQSLRKYSEEQGQPDFELEKFVVNSVLAATHTSEMDPKDQDDIIKKVKDAGKGDDVKPKDDAEMNPEPEAKPETSNDEPELGEDPLAESDNFLIKPKKLSIFAPEGSEEAKFKHTIKEKLKESFNQEDMTTAPVVEPKPVIKPTIEPKVAPKPNRRNKPFLPQPNVNPRPKAKMEEKSDKGPKYTIYHDSFTQAATEAENYAKARGFEVDPSDWFNQVGVGARPAEGETKKFHIELLKNGETQKVQLNFQVFGMPNKYELNAYIS